MHFLSGGGGGRGQGVLFEIANIVYCFNKLPALLPFAIGNPVRCFLAWELRSIAGITSFEHL